MSEHNLNKEQEAICGAPRRPLIIVAGAGTGKTFTLTEMFSRRVMESAGPEAVLGITFTDKAAANFKQKVMERTGQPADSLWISTFHAFCLRLLRRHAIRWDLDPDFRILSSAEKSQILERIVYNYLDQPPEDRHQNIRHVGDAFDTGTKGMVRGLATFLDQMGSTPYASTEMRSFLMSFRDGAQKKSKGTEDSKEGIAESEDHERKVEDALIQVVCDLAEQYETYMKDNQCMDFNRIEKATLFHLREDDEVRQGVAGMFREVLVDEFQDTSLAELSLLELLCPQGDTFSNLVVVGDPRQSIFGFRGTRLENILEMEDRYRKNVIELTLNYRSHPHILSVANDVIKDHPGFEDHSGIKAPPDLPHDDDSSHVEVVYGLKKELKGEWSENDFLARRIQALVQEKIPGTERTTRYSDIAILGKTNEKLRDISRVLTREGIPNLVIGSSSSGSELAELLSLLFIVVDDPLNEDSLIALLESPLCGVDDPTLYALRLAADNQGVGLYESLVRCAGGELPELEESACGEGVKRLKRFGRFLDAAAGKKKTATLEESVEFILEESGFHVYLETREAGAELVMDHIRKALMAAASAGSGFSTLRLLAEHLTIEAQESLARGAVENILEAAGNVVLLLTVHTGKGLEFPVVFVPSVHGASFPSYFRTMNRGILYHEKAGLVARKTSNGITGRYLELEEKYLKPEHKSSELRLFYVAITRAKHLLILSENHGRGTAPYLKKMANSSVAEKILFYDKEKWEELEEKAGRHPAREEEEGLDFQMITDRAEMIRKAADQASHQVVKISPTDAVNFNECPYRYLLARMNIPREDAASRLDMAQVGSFVHDAVWQFSVQEDRDQAFLRALVEDYPWPSDESRRVAENCLDNFLEWWKSNGNLLGAEVPFHLSHEVRGHRLLVEIHGQIDHVKSEGANVAVVDFKTDRDPGKTDHSLQLQLYALALQEIYPERKLEAKVVYLSGPSFLEEPIPVTQGNLDAASKKIEQMALALQDGDFSHMCDPEKCRTCFWSKEKRNLCPYQSEIMDAEPFEVVSSFRDRREYYHYFWDLLCREQEYIRNRFRETTASGLETLVESGVCLVLSRTEEAKGSICRYLLENNLSRFREGDFVDLYRNLEDLQKKKLGFEAQIEELSHRHIVLSSRERERDVPWGELNLAVETHGVLFVQRMSHTLSRFKRGFGVTPGSQLEQVLLKGDSDESAHDPIKVSGPFLPCKAGWTEKDLSADQLQAVEMVMQGHPVSLVQGPAGTGKTTTVGTIVRTVLENTEKRILLASFTNRAVDQMAMEILHLEETCGGAGSSLKGLETLFSRIARREVVSEKRLQKYVGGEGDLGKIKEMLMRQRVVAATAATLGAEDLKDARFDLAIVDESSQALEPALLSILEKADKVVLVGDDKQLPPVVSLPGPPGEALSISLFQRLMEPARAGNNGGVPYVMLCRQFRMHETIMKLAGDLFYDGKLEAGYNRAETDKLLKINFDASKVNDTKLRDVLSPETPLVFWDLKPHTSPLSQVSEVEEEKVVSILGEYLKCGLEPRDMGVITPYRKQVGRLRLAVRSLPTTKVDLGDIYIDTIDRFQGSEKKLIILSSLTTSGSVPALLDDSRRLNVAITRAEEKLVILGSTQCGEKDSLWQRMLEIWPNDRTALIV